MLGWEIEFYIILIRIIIEINNQTSHLNNLLNYMKLFLYYLIKKLEKNIKISEE